MIRTFVTPTQKNQKIEFDFPEDYLGKEIEIILFKKTRRISNPKT